MGIKSPEGPVEGPQQKISCTKNAAERLQHLVAWNRESKGSDKDDISHVSLTTKWDEATSYKGAKGSQGRSDDRSCYCDMTT
jgi:hypothetical protein